MNKVLLTPLVFVFLVFSPSVNGQTLVLNPSADSFLRSFQPDQANGNSAEMLVGIVATGDFTRSVLAFDLSSPLLTGATIDSVTLTFITTTNDGGSVDVGNRIFNLHQLTQSFENNTVTWNVRDTGQNWTNAGGTFSGVVLSSLSANPDTIPAGSTLIFDNTANFATAVGNNIGGTLYLLAKIGSETGSDRGLLRLNSQNATTPGLRPVLTINYTAIPEPGTWALIVTAVAGIIILRRRQNSKSTKG